MNLIQKNHADYLENKEIEEDHKTKNKRYK